MFRRETEGETEGERIGLKRLVGSAVILIVMLGAVFTGIFITTMFVSVGVGHAVLLVDPVTKEVSEPMVGPRWVIKAPWVRAEDIYYATDTFEDTIACFSGDQLEMQVTVLIRWSLDVNNLRALYRNYPRMDYEVQIESMMEETTKLVTKEYTALQTIGQRDVVVDRIEQAVFKEIREEPSLAGALTRLEMDVRDIGYPEQYMQSIEIKLVAEQQKIQADFERQRILIMANATAQEAIIEAEGYAEAKIIEAKGVEEAIRIMVEMYPEQDSTRILELYLYLKTLQELDIQVVILGVGEDGMPVILNLPSQA